MARKVSSSGSSGGGIGDLVNSFVSAVQEATVSRIKAAILNALGVGSAGPGGGRASSGRRRPKQLCPVPGCRNPAAPVFGMVCRDHKDVSKAQIKKYREARKSGTALAAPAGKSPRRGKAKVKAKARSKAKSRGKTKAKPKGKARARRPSPSGPARAGKPAARPSVSKRPRRAERKPATHRAGPTKKAKASGRGSSALATAPAETPAAEPTAPETVSAALLV